MHNDKIKVTIYCAAYNQEKYIRDALEGFVRQKTSFAYEVLVHDDASTDGTAAIIKEYELKYPDIIKPIYQKENLYAKGINRVYAYLLPITNGKYIALCEGDDYWTDEYKLQKQYDYMESHPDCSLVAHKTVKRYMRDGFESPFSSYDYSKEENCELQVEDIIRNHLLFHTSSLFYRTKFYYDNETFLRENHNFDYVLKILLATEGMVHVIPEVMSVYRYGTESSWTVKTQDIEKWRKHYLYAIEVLNKIDGYREYKYTKVIQENILERQFKLYVETGEFDKLKEEPYKSRYEKLSFKSKLLIGFKRCFPTVSKHVLSGNAYWNLRKLMIRKNKNAK